MKWPEVVQWLSQQPCGCNEDEYRWIYEEAMQVPGKEGDILMEIGSWRGASTLTLAAVAQERGMQVYSVDSFMLGVLRDETPQAPIYKENRFEIFEANVSRLIASGLRPYVSIVNDDSLRFGLLWQPTRPISFLWIDGNHVYPFALREWAIYSLWIPTGGVIGIHDAHNPTEAGRCIEELHHTRQMADWEEVNLPALMTPVSPTTILQHRGEWWTRGWRRK